VTPQSFGERSQQPLRQPRHVQCSFHEKPLVTQGHGDGIEHPARHSRQLPVKQRRQIGRRDVHVRRPAAPGEIPQRRLGARGAARPG
jgi:hypothetical protein